VQATLLRRLGNAALYNADSERAERLSNDAAQLATALGMDTLAALAYSTLYSLAAFVDPDAKRALSFSRSKLPLRSERLTQVCTFMRFARSMSLQHWT